MTIYFFSGFLSKGNDQWLPNLSIGSQNKVSGLNFCTVVGISGEKCMYKVAS